jgi:RHS repeat-associated protein
VRQTLDDTGAVLATTNYDPWGTPQGTLSAPFGFTGELHRAGQVYLRARWYDPTNSTFLTRDPWPGWSESPQSLAPYTYVHNNPPNATDPTGLWMWGKSTSRPEQKLQEGHLRRKINRLADVHTEFPIGRYLPTAGGRGRHKSIDVLHSDTGEIWELEPIYSIPKGQADVTQKLTQINSVSLNQVSYVFSSRRNRDYLNGPYAAPWGTCVDWSVHDGSWEAGSMIHFLPVRTRLTRAIDLVAVPLADPRGVVAFWLEPTRKGERAWNAAKQDPLRQQRGYNNPGLLKPLGFIPSGSGDQLIPGPFGERVPPGTTKRYLPAPGNDDGHDIPLFPPVMGPARLGGEPGVRPYLPGSGGGAGMHVR